LRWEHFNKEEWSGVDYEPKRGKWIRRDKFHQFHEWLTQEDKADYKTHLSG